METHSAGNFCHRHLLFLREIRSALATNSSVLLKGVPPPLKRLIWLLHPALRSVFNYSRHFKAPLSRFSLHTVLLSRTALIL